MISSVINFCSNDFRFLRACIEGALPFSSQILIPVCDHFFNGEPENYALLEETYRQFPNCTFLEFAFDPQESYRQFSPLYPDHPYWRHDWHNTNRWISYFFLEPTTDFIVFLDCDEIVDGQRFKKWLKNASLDSYSCLRLAAYWYFREANLRADTHADITLLVKRTDLTPDMLWSEDERLGVFDQFKKKKKEGVVDETGCPMIHHYSWVRTIEEFRKKCKTWGHYWERDWMQLIEDEFSKVFQGRDFIRHYQYQVSEQYFDPLSVEVPNISNDISLDKHKTHLAAFTNVIRVDKKEMWRRSLNHLLIYE